MKTGRVISKEKILLRPFGIGAEIITAGQYDQRMEEGTLAKGAHYMVVFDETSVNHVDKLGRVINMERTACVPPPEGMSEMTLPDLLKNQSVVWLQGRPPPEALEWAEEELALFRQTHTRERSPDDVYDDDEIEEDACRPY